MSKRKIDTCLYSDMSLNWTYCTWFELNGSPSAVEIKKNTCAKCNNYKKSPLKRIDK